MPLILMFKSEHFKVWCVLLLLSVITHSVYITLKMKSVIPFFKGEMLFPYLRDSW